MSVKFVYFFRGGLEKHVDIYKSWVDVVSNDVDIDIMTVMDSARFKNQKKLAEKYSKLGVKIYYANKILLKPFVFFYFLYLVLKHKKIIVHLRKQSPAVFKCIKAITNGRLRYVVEMEGDFESELDYLSDEKKSPFRNFYAKEIEGLKKSVKRHHKDILFADGVVVPTPELKKIYMERYSDLDSEAVFTLPTFFSKDKFYFNKRLRDLTRKEYSLEGKTVLVFCGGLHYSWQNIKRSIEIFNEMNVQGLCNNLHFLILARESDHYIAREFMNDMKICEEDFLIDSVPHEKVNAMLNASDIAILLRENHILNKVVSTGKMGEYLAAGLPVITSKHIGIFSERLCNKDFAFLFDDIYSNEELSTLFDKGCMATSCEQREEISKWAHRNFSVESCKSDYINILHQLEK